MPTRKGKMMWTSIDGPEPEVSLTDEDWIELERVYGRKLDQTTRDEMAAICNSYLWSRQAETTAEPLDKIQKYASKALKLAQPLWTSLVEGHGEGDAYSAYEAQFEDFIGQIGLPLQPSMLSKMDIKEEAVEFIPYEGQKLYLQLTPQLVQEVLDLAMVAWSRVERGDGLTEPGFKDGTAFNHFLLTMRDYARGKGWKIGPYVTGNKEASPLSQLLFALNRKFPENLRSSQNSPNAVADRLSDLISERNRLERNEGI